MTLVLTDPAAVAWTPALTPLTVFVSPASMSVSLVRTLPVGLVPAVPLAVPPASTAVAVSATAIGLSLMAVTVIEATSVAVLNGVVPPLVEASTLLPAVPTV